MVRTLGEVTERLKVRDWKSRGRVKPPRGFESHPLRSTDRPRRTPNHCSPGPPEPDTIASMLGAGQRRLVLAASSALVIAGLFGAPATTAASPPYGQVSFSVPSLSPKFAPNVHDYVVRCNNRPVTVNAHVSARLGGDDRQPSVPQRRVQRRGATGCRARLHDHRATGGAPAALSLPRALPAERLPRLHLHPPSTRVAGVLLGGQAIFFALRDHLRQPRGADLVVPRCGPRHRGCLRTAPSCGSIALPSNGDPPPGRQPRPHPRSGRPTGQPPRPAATG